jgi:hypothetical protein
MQRDNRLQNAADHLRAITEREVIRYHYGHKHPNSLASCTRLDCQRVRHAIDCYDQARDKTP